MTGSPARKNPQDRTPGSLNWAANNGRMDAGRVVARIFARNNGRRTFDSALAYRRNESGTRAEVVDVSPSFRNSYVFRDWFSASLVTFFPAVRQWDRKRIRGRERVVIL